MDKHAAALVLDEIGTLMELLGEDRFRSRAYLGAARALDGLDGDLAERAAAGELAEVPGLGPATLRVVRELLERGESSLHRKLRERTPSGMIELLAIPGLGPRRIHTLHERLGIQTLDDLERAARAGLVAELPKFGERTQASILEGIAFVRGTAGRRRLSRALVAADRVLGWIEALAGVERALAAGELRRRMETVDRVDALVVTRSEAVRERLETVPGAARVEPDADGVRAWLADGLEVRIRVVGPDRLGATWICRTGSDDHLAALRARAADRGLRLEPDGLWRDGEPVPASEEAAVYRRLELEWVPPELREGRGEVEAAAAGSLPELVEYEDLRGCFHCHTSYSDGKATLREMAEAALDRGWRYLGIGDHSEAASYAGGLHPDTIRRQHAEIDRWNRERGDELWLFKGIEADILSDGRLDWEGTRDDVLASFDYVVGSVHSGFKQPRQRMTKRLLRALSNPHLTFLGHATGRLLLRREGYPVDLDAVIDAAAERGAGIEINADPVRLDMDWRHWKSARDRGVVTAINPDAHSTRGLGAVRYGVAMARKGWLRAEDVVNAWELERVKEYFESRVASRESRGGSR